MALPRWRPRYNTFSSGSVPGFENDFNGVVRFGEIDLRPYKQNQGLVENDRDERKANDLDDLEGFPLHVTIDNDINMTFASKLAGNIKPKRSSEIYSKPEMNIDRREENTNGKIRTRKSAPNAAQRLESTKSLNMDSGNMGLTTATENPNVFHLPRGGTIVNTEIGCIQFGIPPETIKDSMDMSIEVPQFFVVPSERFSCRIGPQQGLNLAEFEFPAYFNFFIKNGRKICLIVDNENVKGCIKQVFQETLLGPKDYDPDVDFSSNYPKDKRPRMLEELKYFQKFGDQTLSVDLMLDFAVFGPKQEVTLFDPNDSKKCVTICRTLDEYSVFDSDLELICSLSTEISVRPRAHYFLQNLTSIKPLNFSPPAFGITVLGSSHGFDPLGKTSGYVLWINHRGIMVDPPPNSTRLLQKNFIPPCLIDAVIVTHCHADHDAGTFQKILQEGRVTLYTTQTIMGCFLRKYSALSGLTIQFLQTVFKFKQVRIGDIVKFHGGQLSFFYTLHSIPCIGFEAFFGGKSVVFSADHMNDPEKIKELFDIGILPKGRRDELLKFPWHHDVILHEAGVPPIHTPIKTLIALPEDIKKKLYVVHTSAASIPLNSGLKVAQPGVQKTIVIDGVSPPSHSNEFRKIALVSGIEMFSDLGLKYLSDVATSSCEVEFNEGDVIVPRGQDSDAFYIIESGVCEIKVHRSKSFIRNEFDGHMGADSDVDQNTGNVTRDRNGKCNCQTTSTGACIDPLLCRPRTHTEFKRTQSHSIALGSVSAEANSNRTRGRPKTQISSGSDGVNVKTFYAGEYFGESSLVSDFSLRRGSIIASTKVIALKFDPQSFRELLIDAGILKKMEHLVTMRARRVLETIDNNTMLRSLTSPQKTQLETYFVKKKFKDGEIIWSENSPCDFGVLVHNGQVTYTKMRNAFHKRKGSGVHYDVNFLYDEMHGAQNPIQSASINSIDNDSPKHLLNNNDVFHHIHTNASPDSVESLRLLKNVVGERDSLQLKKMNNEYRRKSMVPIRTLKIAENQVMEKVTSVVFKRGAFVGDVDGLFSNSSSTNKYGLKAVGTVELLVVQREELQKFFTNNPGVLLSMLHTQFIV